MEILASELDRRIELNYIGSGKCKRWGDVGAIKMLTLAEHFSMQSVKEASTVGAPILLVPGARYAHCNL